MKCQIALIILLSGCLNQTVTEKFVCSDGWVVDTASGCEGHTPTCPKCACEKTVCPACQPCPLPTLTNVSPSSQQTAAPSSDSCASLGCPLGTKYVSSKSSQKYHTCGCRFAEVLSKKNIICYGSASEAEAAGRQPCGICAKSG